MRRRQDRRPGEVGAALERSTRGLDCPFPSGTAAL